jgi:GTP-binding protein Era
MPKAGIVTVAVKPNAGMSTLLNRLVGEKLSIVSPKPQSTRDRIVGIRSERDVQMILLDTPGLLDPRYPLQQAMRGTAIAALSEADVILYVVDATSGDPEPLAELARLEQQPDAPVLIAANKSDLLSGPSRERLASARSDLIFISATTGDGVAALSDRITSLLPESPFFYPEDEISTQTVRFFAGELIRETALEQLEDEIPYSVACAIEEFREAQTPVYIRAVLYVERDSQKRILIGAGGGRIREIGRHARGKIERFLGTPIYLDLWVKVLPNWRRNVNALLRFGYHVPEKHSP